MDNPNDSTSGVQLAITEKPHYVIGHKYPMPSGNVPLLRKPSLLKLAGGKGAPDFITNIVMKGMKGEKTGAGELKPEDLPGIVALLDDLCIKAYIWPKVRPSGEDPNYDHDEISVDDISDEDKFEIFSWLLGEDGVDAITFRQKQVSSVGDVPAMPEVAQAT